MLQEIARNGSGSGWAIASLVFFLAWFVAVAAWVVTRKRGYFDAQAALPLDDPSPRRDATATPPGRES